MAEEEDADAVRLLTIHSAKVLEFKVVIVADSTKFGRPAMVHLAPLDVADVVVSDSGLAPEYRDMLAESGVEVLLA